MGRPTGTPDRRAHARRRHHEERERLFGQADHVRVYGRDFTARLEQAGFTVRVEDLTRELGEEARRYGLRPRRPDLHLCTKEAA